jgi:hypothetical protein
VSSPLAPELPETVRRLFSHLRHAGPWEGTGMKVVQGEAGSVKLGVHVRFFWQVEGSLIRAARYQAYGCPYTLAACEWLAQAMPGRSRERPWPGDPRQWLQALEAPPERLGRFLVIEDALRAVQAGWG